MEKFEEKHINNFVRTNTKMTKFVENIFKKGVANFEKEGLSILAEDITNCERRIYYKYFQKEPEIKTKQIKIKQEVLNLKWLDFFNNSVYSKVIRKNEICSDWNYSLSGTGSLIELYDNCCNHVVVFKAYYLSNKDFEKVKEIKGYRNHICEMTALLYLFEINNGLIIFENEENFENLFVHVVVNEQILNGIFKKCQYMLTKNINKHILPERPYGSNNSKECKNCEYIELCWKE